ncbi:hypothetical protein HZA96_01435 [Candidatus Woesearchaeota archaeon]|nr:hypothetical protein [Candidatus Woesearchaeota archaeon]
MEKEYLIQHLIMYVEFQMENGYELSDIADALLNYGYKKEIISKIIGHFKDVNKDVKQKKFIKRLPSRDKDIMKEDMAIYIQNMLIDYVKKQQKLGFSLKSIEHALIQVGHHKDIAQKAIKTIKKGEYVDFQQSLEVKKYPLSLLFILISIISIAVIFMISVATNENLLLVFITFAPMFMGLIILYAFVTFARTKAIITITPPIVLMAVIGIFFYFSNTTTIYQNTDMQILLGLNIAIAFFAALIISIFGRINLGNETKEIKNGDYAVHKDKNNHNNVSHSTHNLINILEDEEVENNELIKNKNSKKDSTNEKIKIKEFLP